MSKKIMNNHNDRVDAVYRTGETQKRSYLTRDRTLLGKASEVEMRPVIERGSALVWGGGREED